MLCLYAFPHCYQDTYLPLCYEDCIAVRELFCYKEWAIIEANKQRGIFYKSKGHFSLPQCENLPHNSKNGKAVCSHAMLTELQQDEITSKYKKFIRNFMVFENATDVNLNCCYL